MDETIAERDRRNQAKKMAKTRGQDYDKNVLYLSCKEIAKALGVTVNAIHKQIQRKVLPAKKYHADGSYTYRIHPDDAERFVKWAKGQN